MHDVKIGVIAKPHGVRGEMRVHLYNADSTALEVVSEVQLKDIVYAIASARLVRGGALLKLDEVTTRDQAERLVGTEVCVTRSALELDDDDVLLDELVGCQTKLESGEDWGEIVEVISGVQDRLVIHQGGTERYLPLVDAFVVDIDLEAKVVILAPPPDLPEWER